MSRARRALLAGASLWRSLRDYLGTGRGVARGPVSDPAALRAFLESRASYVAQASLYGYLRTRAGMRYPVLFDDDRYVVSINAAKWYLWLACLSDLSVYAGGLLVSGQAERARQVGRVMTRVTDAILDATGVPEDAGEGFLHHVRALRERIARCDWSAVADDGGVFTQSPAALVRHAPIIDELKQLDEEIVLNSVRFRWNEVRRELRDCLDAAGVLASASCRP